MYRFDGTSARQLTLIEETGPTLRHEGVAPQLRLRLLQKDIYAELARRRRKAQIQARHLLDRQ